MPVRHSKTYGRPGSTSRSQCRFHVATLLLLLLPGCGSGEATGEVAGTLTLRGAPVSQGSLVFFREPGVPAGVADLNSAGEFHLSEPLPTGTYQLAFFFDDGEVAGAPATGSPKQRPEVPSKYWNETTSGLTITVAAGDNSFPIDMP